MPTYALQRELRGQAQYNSALNAGSSRGFTFSEDAVDGTGEKPVATF